MWSIASLSKCVLHSASRCSDNWFFFKPPEFQTLMAQSLGRSVLADRCVTHYPDLPSSYEYLVEYKLCPGKTKLPKQTIWSSCTDRQIYCRTRSIERIQAPYKMRCDKIKVTSQLKQNLFSLLENEKLGIGLLTNQTITCVLDEVAYYLFRLLCIHFLILLSKSSDNATA